MKQRLPPLLLYRREPAVGVVCVLERKEAHEVPSTFWERLRRRLPW